MSGLSAVADAVRRIMAQAAALDQRVARLERVEYPMLYGMRAVSVDSSFVGLALLVTAGESITAGMVCEFSQATDQRVLQAAADSDMPTGIAYEDGTAGNPMWMIVYGFAQVLPKAAVTLTKGYIAYVSDTKGYANNSSTLPTAAEHAREIGIVYKQGSGAGAKGVVLLHYN